VIGEGAHEQWLFSFERQLLVSPINIDFSRISFVRKKRASGAYNFVRRDKKRFLHSHCVLPQVLSQGG
jgi:hypothetical protein